MPYSLLASAPWTMLAVLLSGLLAGPVVPAAGQPAAADGLAGRTYTFSAPDATVWLPADLREVSGLALVNDTLVAAVQDELGVLYLVDTRTGTIHDELRFAARGDYEDLAFHEGALYILRSDGTLFRIPDWRRLPADVFPLALGLPPGCDAEGLTSRPKSSTLLIACKEEPGPDLGPVKAVYAYDTAQQRRAKAPAFTIPVATFVAYLDDGLVNRTVRRLLDPFADLSGFKPSALAIHPTTDQLYLLSSARSALVVLTPQGEILDVHVLPKGLLPQPEALAFFPNGDLLIATEGGSGRARFHRFRYR